MWTREFISPWDLFGRSIYKHSQIRPYNNAKINHTKYFYRLNALTISRLKIGRHNAEIIFTSEDQVAMRRVRIALQQQQS